MTRFALPGLTAVGLVFAAAGFAQQPQTTPNTDQPKMEHGQMGGTGQAQPGPGMGQKGMEMGKQGMGMGMGQQSPAQNTDQGGTGAGTPSQAQPQGTQGMGMGQQRQGMGQGGTMKDMHQMMHPSGASSTNPPAAATPAPQTGQAPAPAPQCPAGTTVQMDANGQHVCK